MQEIIGNIWDFADKGWIIIPTNGIIKKDGNAVMGAGLALEAAKRYPELPKKLGERLIKSGNHIYFFLYYNVVTFPTKHDWKDPSNLELIRQSASELAACLIPLHNQGREIKFFLPRIGCGLGGLEWHNVQEVIQPYLNEPEFIFVTPKPS